MENQRKLIAPPEDCRLYEVKISQLVSKTNVYKSFLESLLDVSRGDIKLDWLKLMVSNRRNQLFVLLGPVNIWNSDACKIYSVIQVRMEGKIDGVPELSDEIATDEIGDCFKKITPYMPPDLVGARIISSYSQGHACVALQLLASYYNGDAAEDALELIPKLESSVFTQLQRRSWADVHYLGVIHEPDLAQYNSWESNGFSFLFIGKLQENTEVVIVMIKFLHDYDIIKSYNKYCSYLDLFSSFRSTFMRNLSSTLNSLDHSIALRILNMKYKKRLQYKPWSATENKRIIAFIRDECRQELILHLIRTTAELYFDGDLPIEFSEIDKCVLVLFGLQHHTTSEIKEIMNFSEEDINESYKRILERAYDFINYVLFPKDLAE